ncbi:MAG: SdpI family protein [Candidatus Moranbacteria bacterium]|nr:SdpI family protein [Candidatus Moranbacteria bacterium]
MQRAIPLFVIILSFILAIYFYPQMPPLMASHWGLNGLADGYSTKQFALFLIPAALTILYPFFLLLPSSGPYKKNFHEFSDYYDVFVSLVFFFLFYLYVLTLIWNLNIYFNMLQFLSPAFSIVFYYAGLLSSKTKRNWFVGIRTPWAYKSDIVWQKTQTFGGNMFKISSVICLFSLILPKLSAVLIIVPIIFSAIAVNVYSYSEAQKHQKVTHKGQ